MVALMSVQLKMEYRLPTSGRGFHGEFTVRVFVEGAMDWIVRTSPVADPDNMTTTVLGYCASRERVTGPHKAFVSVRVLDVIAVELPASKIFGVVDSWDKIDSPSPA